MITNADIIKLAKVLATKQDIIELRTEMSDMKNSINSLTTTVDGLAKKVDKLETETLTIKHRIGLI